MTIQNTSGPFSRKDPKFTNPAIYGIPDKQAKDEWLQPNSDITKSPFLSFRNVDFMLTNGQINALAEHYNMHIKNNTFGTSDSSLESMDKLLEHQELMAFKMLDGWGFDKAHKWAIKNGPSPVN